jgi:predicted RNA-binding Zn ribbon-like protein
MATVLVHGVRLPVLVGGHPALDLCNTFVGWGEQESVDLLADYRTLVRFAEHAGLMGSPDVDALLGQAERSPRAAAGALLRARELRAATYGIVTGDAAPAAWEAVRRAVRAAVRGSALRPGEDSLGRWTVEVGSAGLLAPVHAFAWQVSSLLVQVPVARVGRCPGSQCGWVFLDRGNRRWCLMATCGNRAKARRHAARRVPAGPPAAGSRVGPAR